MAGILRFTRGGPGRRRGDPLYYSPRWRRLRQLVLQRDGYRCVICGADVSGSGCARVDHIKPRQSHPELTFEISNLRSLCSDCDNQAHREKRETRTVGERHERFRGVDGSGVPIDPKHHWNK